MNDVSYSVLVASLALLVVGSARLTVSGGGVGAVAWLLVLFSLAALVLVVTREADR